MNKKTTTGHVCYTNTCAYIDGRHILLITIKIYISSFLVVKLLAQYIKGAAPRSNISFTYPFRISPDGCLKLEAAPPCSTSRWAYIEQDIVIQFE